ncbi:hypothetical protein F5Y15DRAFT_382567 [Xylariaceae sp. FL0016]|nr:hypothetical protein F5Y15DRAFT_382567 [Xylariaceae sp. FL0016]
MTAPKIAIIGAGPVGLTLASILHHNDITCTVFERDSHAQVRAQGGTLDIHPASGQRALVAAGLLDKFQSIVRPEGEAMRIYDKQGTLLLDMSGEPPARGQDNPNDDGLVQDRPEIDRKALKDLLVESLPPDTIHWNSGVASLARVPGTPRWTITFLDGSASQPYDLVVGADGAWSRVRPLLTSVEPQYSGISCLDTWCDDVDATAPRTADFVGGCNCFIFDSEAALLFQRNGDGSARCYACVRTPDAGTPPSAQRLLGIEGKGEDVDWEDASNRKRFVESHFGEWFDEAKEALLSLTERSTVRHLLMLPVGLTWESKVGITIVGDAAHLMTPFAGVGVNVGMMDALELADGIVAAVRENRPDLAELVAEYEKGMFERSRKDAEHTYHAMQLQFQADGGQRMIELMGGGGGGVSRADE